MIDHIVTPRSMKDIRTIVNVIKKRCGFYDYLLFPVMFFWEQIIPKIFQDYRFLYVEDDELKGFEAYTDHNLRLVKVKVSVYEKALNGSPKDLSNGKGKITYMADGSIITFRPTTKSDNYPGVNINISKSTDSGGIKQQKIHFGKEEDRR